MALRLRPLAVACLLAGVVAAPAAARADAAPAAPAAPAGSGPPAAIPLDAGWGYRADPDDTGLDGAWWRGDGDWSPVAVPNVMNPKPLEQFFDGSVGWYRLSFLTPPPSSFDWALRFESVRRTAQVWMNGHYLGEHTDPYVPFQLAARDLNAPGVANTLVVRVDNRKGKEPREGWWNWGGIVRPVELVPRGALELDDLGLLPALSCHKGRCRARVHVDGILHNRTGARVAPRVGVWLRSPHGTTTQLTAKLPPVAGGHSEHVRFDVPVRGTPQLWSPPHPNLYDAIVETRLGSRVQQRDSLRIGLKSVKVHHGLLYLNGRRVELRGASIQEDLPGKGPALDQADIDEIVGELKALGANVTRAHYLLNDRLLSALDAAGILLWNQAPIYHRDHELKTAKGRAQALSTLRNSIYASRNHASVLVNSVANELSTQPDVNHTTGDYLRAAARTARALDPEVPVALDVLSYPGYPKQKTYDDYDVLGINNYFGWYPGRKGHSTARMRDLAPYLRSMRAKYPKQAMLMTEFGAESAAYGPATEKGTYEFQDRYLRNTLRVVERFKWLGGAIYWTLREFAVKPQWTGGAVPAEVGDNSIHKKGLITYDGQRKPAWDIAHAEFARTPLFPR